MHHCTPSAVARRRHPLDGRHRACIALACAALLVPAIARAQDATPDAPLRIALVDTLSTPQARAEVIRVAGGDQPDLVLLRARDATIEDLGGALAMLRRMRDRPATPDRNVRATLTGATPTRPIPDARRATLQRALALVRTAPVADIAPLGRGRWADFPGTRLER